MINKIFNTSLDLKKLENADQGNVNSRICSVSEYVAFTRLFEKHTLFNYDAHWKFCLKYILLKDLVSKTALESLRKTSYEMNDGTNLISYECDLGNSKAYVVASAEQTIQFDENYYKYIIGFEVGVDDVNLRYGTSFSEDEINLRFHAYHNESYKDLLLKLENPTKYTLEVYKQIYYLIDELNFNDENLGAL